MLIKTRKPRKFNYIPRYYDPEKEDGENTRIKFQRLSKSKPPRQKSLLLLALAAALLFYIFYYLNQIAKSDKETQADKMKVEEIIIVD